MISSAALRPLRTRVTVFAGSSPPSPSSSPERRRRRRRRRRGALRRRPARAPARHRTRPRPCLGRLVVALVAGGRRPGRRRLAPDLRRRRPPRRRLRRVALVAVLAAVVTGRRRWSPGLVGVGLGSSGGGLGRGRSWRYAASARRSSRAPGRAARRTDAPGVTPSLAALGVGRRPRASAGGRLLGGPLAGVVFFAAGFSAVAVGRPEPALRRPAPARGRGLLGGALARGRLLRRRAACRRRVGRAAVGRRRAGCRSRAGRGGLLGVVRLRGAGFFVAGGASPASAVVVGGRRSCPRDRRACRSSARTLRAAPDVSDADDPRGQGRRRKAFGGGDTLRRCVTVVRQSPTAVAGPSGRAAVTNSAGRVAVR